MKFTEKLESYFNTGSTEKQNQKRLGGLLIGITAVLLAVSIILLVVVPACQAIGDAIEAKKNEKEDNSPAVNNDLVDATLEEITALDNAYLLDTSKGVTLTIANSDVKRFQPINRPKNEDGDNLYMCERSNDFALQTVAFEQFNEMIKEFYKEEGDINLWVKQAYDVSIENNPNEYATALTVQLDYLVEYIEETSRYITATTYGVETYEWIYDNCHEYGFVRASNEEGKENVFRYVGLDHAKHIESKNTSKKFYGVNDYLNDLKGYTAGKLTVRSVPTEITDGTTKKITHYVYFVPATGPYKLPDSAEFSYTVSSNNSDGYVVSYWEKA